MRPYFTGYLPTLLLAAILTPATVAVIGLYDLKSMAIVVITLPLIPIFMVLIGLATTNPSAAALAAMTAVQAPGNQHRGGVSLRSQLAGSAGGYRGQHLTGQVGDHCAGAALGQARL